MVSLRELAELWVHGRQKRGEIHGRSVEVTLTRLARLVAQIAHPAHITRRALLEWQASIGHQAPATRRSTVGTVAMFLRWLHDEGHVDTDLTVHLVRVREPRRAPRALSHPDVAAILASCPSPRGRVVVTLMVQCGLRCVEVSRLDLDDYDRQAQTIFVRGKAGHERVLPLTDDAVNAINAYLPVRGLRPGPLILAVGSKAAPDRRVSARWISKRTARLMADAGVHSPGDRRTAHALRHTAASDVLDQCHDVRTVQQMLGHASLQSTEIYLRRADLDRLRQAMGGRTYVA